MIYQSKRGTITVPASDTITSGTTEEVIHGQLTNLFVSVPALEGTGTATILGTEVIGGTVYASTALAESTIGRIAPIGTPTVFGGTLYLVATTTNATDGTQSANRDITYTIHYESKQG